MSKTNALRNSRPIEKSPESKPSTTPAAIPASNKNSGSGAEPEVKFTASEIAALRAFFELLDQWDRKETEE